MLKSEFFNQMQLLRRGVTPSVAIKSVAPYIALLWMEEVGIEVKFNGSPKLNTTLEAEWTGEKYVVD